MRARPNVVLFISDQQRADTMPGECPVPAHTPHLAWLAERGATFRNAFCASPICTPARAALLTGQYPHTNRVEANYAANPLALRVPDDVKLLADHLKPAGYACAYTGKWHLPTGDDRRGFSDYVSRLTKWDVDSEASDDAARFARKVGVDIGDNYTAYLRDEVDETAVGETAADGATKLPLAWHPSTLQAQKAAHFIRRMKGAGAPFVLAYSCIEPHPLGMRYNISPCPFDRMHDPAQMPLPATLRDPAAAEIMRRRDFPGLKPAASFTDEQIREMIAGYYGAVSYTDHLAGLLLEALIETGQFDNTLFVFLSDHGEMLGSHGMLKKGPIMFDEMIRTPLLVKPPGRMKGRDVEQIVSHVDLLPTILGYCGAEPVCEHQGVDARGLIEGDRGEVRGGVASEYHSCQWGDRLYPLRCWRTREWKYVETQGMGDELYDLRADPSELNNLAEKPARRDELERMKADLRAWQRKTGDPWPEVRRAGGEG